MAALDLNADLGETVAGVPTADDEAMYAMISSASVACGGHAGDRDSMREAVARAARYRVAIGAHPSYPDRAGFGRMPVPISPAELTESVSDQLVALAGAGADIRYVKPHGALYHAVGADPEIAAAVMDAVARLSEASARPIPVLGMGDLAAEAAKQAGLPFFYEAYLDRGYRADGSLVPRGQPGDLLHDATEVADRAVRLASAGTVVAADGSVIACAADSLCLHGDTPESVALARAVRAALQRTGIDIRAPW